MAFILKSDNDDGDVVNKAYLYPIGDAGFPGRNWMYVTEDAATVVDLIGYIDVANESTQGDHPRIAVDMLRVGDRIWVNTVSSIDDTRDIEADLAGLSAVNCLIVLTNDGSLIDMSESIAGGATVNTD